MGKTEHIRVVAIRSGPTAWDDERRLAGTIDLPLSGTGRTEVNSQLKGLAGARLTLLLSAPDEASRETARVAMRLINQAPPCDARVVPELAEVSLGLWEGRLESDLEAKCPTTYRQWRDDPAAVVAPEGETLEEAEARLVSAIRANLPRRPTGAVGVVLRPFAHAVMVSWLGSRALTGIRSMLDDRTLVHWRTVPPGAFRRQAARTAR